RTTPAPQRASKPWGWHGLPNRCCKSKASPLHVQIRHTRGGAKRRGGVIRSVPEHVIPQPRSARDDPLDILFEQMPFANERDRRIAHLSKVRVLGGIALLDRRPRIATSQPLGARGRE